MAFFFVLVNYCKYFDKRRNKLEKLEKVELNDTPTSTNIYKYVIYAFFVTTKTLKTFIICI